MTFTSKHRNDSPTVHGLSFGAMNAHSHGKLSKVELVDYVKKTYGFKITQKESLEFLCNGEWHHVQHNGRVVEMHFGNTPDAEDWKVYEDQIVEARKLKSKKHLKSEETAREIRIENQKIEDNYRTSIYGYAFCGEDYIYWSGLTK